MPSYPELYGAATIIWLAYPAATFGVFATSSRDPSATCPYRRSFHALEIDDSSAALLPSAVLVQSSVLSARTAQRPSGSRYLAGFEYEYWYAARFPGTSSQSRVFAAIAGSG